MKKKYEESVEIPHGIEFTYSDDELVCRKGSREIKRRIFLPDVKIKVEDKKILFTKEKSNKTDIKKIKSNIAHIRNMFKGIEKDFVYKMEICFVHFPITAKVEGNKIVVGNFLGEKKTREAKICEGIKVEVKGKEIFVSGHDLEAAGQTAANIERATSITGRDRRIFQDGIFIIEKHSGEGK